MFTKQDAITFGLGWGAAVLLEVGLILRDIGDEPDWERLGLSLAVGSLAATGRYLVTRIPEILQRRQ